METQENTVRSVDRALSILDCFSKEQSTLSLMQISKAVSLPVTTVLRLLITLEQNGYVLKDSSTGMYSLGWKLAKLGNIAFAGLDVCNVAYPFLEQLHSLHNESFGLYIAHGRQRICAARIDSTHSFRQCVSLGSSRPLDSGAAGHVLIAYSQSPETEEVLKYSKYCSPALVNRVRREGYSISRGEFTPGTYSIASPVFNANGTIAAALMVTGPAIRIEPLQKEFIELIKDFAGRISAQLGYQK